MKNWRIAFVLLIIAVIATGLTRVRIDTDVFSLLPSGSPTVEGLRVFQKSFGSSQTIIISVRTADANSTTDVVNVLAKQLQSEGLAKQVIWRSPFQNDTEALGEFLAYLWFNQAPTEFNAMAQRFDEGQLQETLARSIERMSTSLNPQEVARLAHDPFSLTTIGNTISTSLVDINKNPFASADGRLRILYVPFPGAQAEFWQYRDWLQSINQLIGDWQKNNELARHSTIRITGNPVFVTEFGSRLLRDVLLAAGSTLIVIVLLFWWAHRRWAPLMWLVLLLMLSVTTTVALSGFLFASLNAISLGFAAILVGLAVDYALILYQEHRSHPELNARKLRQLLAPSILWAAVTTAGAFIMVARSSLPGLTQLGVLVAIGIIIAAVLMLLLYVTLIQRVKVTANNEQDAHQKNNEPGVLNGNRKFAWSATLLLLLVSAIVLSNRSPGIQSGIATLQFENIQASTTLQEIRQEITGLRSDKWLIIRGTDEQQVGLRMANAERVLSRHQQLGVVTRYALPTKLWPQSNAQQENHVAARALVQRLAAVQTATQAAGFTPDSLNLTTAIFEAWQKFVDLDSVVWPKQAASRWLFSQFAANDNGQVVALGQVEVAAVASKQQLQTLVTELVTQDSGQLVGWSLLADSLVETMKHDLTRVVLPMMVVLVMILGLAYREVRGIVLSFATLGFTLVCLVAVMGALQWSWNLMNMTALPLLLGAGVDYSIHIQLALKRYAGDIAQVRRSVGNAILLCGASTAAAFASLGFASNPGLASLGRVVAIGIVIAALTAVFLLPVWWSTVHGHSRLKAIGD